MIIAPGLAFVLALAVPLAPASLHEPVPLTPMSLTSVSLTPLTSVSLTSVSLTPVSLAPILTLATLSPAPPSSAALPSAALPSPAFPPAGTSSAALPSAGALPLARYDAVIPQLDAWPFGVGTSVEYSLKADTSLYDSPGGTAVATMPAHDFLGQRTVVVEVDTLEDWARVLTPARQRLPSAVDYAPAQTSGWLPRASLTRPVVLTKRIVISVAAQTLTIFEGTTVAKQFPVGVGMAGTPTPTGVTGYLQARYFDPGQQRSDLPVQLTSLHSTAVDEPSSGQDGGLIGLHYEKNATGAVSHGCVRMSAAAIRALTALPLGTLVTITP